jgi:hypothetical protein
LSPPRRRIQQQEDSRGTMPEGRNDFSFKPYFVAYGVSMRFQARGHDPGRPRVYAFAR